MTNIEKEAIADQFSEMRTAMIRTFETGATRSPAAGKPEYAGYLSPQVVRAFGAYMLAHQTDSAGGQRESRNWQRGIPMESYMQSMMRHFVDVWTEYESLRRFGEVKHPAEFIESLMALLFNVQGMAHEYIGGQDGA